MEEQEEVKQFSLLALPWLAINLVIRLMETWEHVRLSLTSNKMENTIKRVNIKYRSHTCHIRDRSSGISIGIAHMSVFCGTRPTFTGEHCLTRKELSRWWGPKDTTDFKKLMKVLEKIIYIFPCNHLVFCFYQEKMIRTRIRTVLSHPMFQKCDLLGVVEGKITAKEMNYILDAFTSNETESRHLKLEDIQLPYGYFHEKIFQFGGCTYYSADWITIETLLTIKNCYDLEIGENWLTYADMNRFLKYWAQSEVDMFDDYLNIKMEEDIPEHELFDGITRLNSSRFRSPTYFVMANLAQNQRERQMLVIWYEENKLKLTAWSPEDNCQDTDGKDVSYQKEFDALKDVEKRKELKKKLEENSPDEEIKKEIRELDEKLLEFEVRGEFSIIEEVKQFPLLALPWLAINLVIRLMETWEQVRLSLTSNKMENTIKRVDIKYRSHTCHIRDRSSGISIGIALMSVFCGTRPIYTEKHCLTRKELSRWWGPKDTTDFKKLMKVLEKIVSIFPCDQIGFYFHQMFMKTTRIRTVLNHPVFKKCDSLGVIRGKVTTKEMNSILDAVTSLEYLTLDQLQLPYGYSHEKIFQSVDCLYHWADWITMETLLTMKNCNYVEIGENWLSYTDMNRFLKYWVRSEVDMFNESFYIKMEDDIPEDELFNGITRLNSNRLSFPTYFLMANTTKIHRKRQIIFIYYDEKKLKLSAWSPEDIWKDINGRDICRQIELDALKDAEKRNELKKKLEENDDEEIKKEIRELDEKLLELEVRGKFSIIESS